MIFSCEKLDLKHAKSIPSSAVIPSIFYGHIALNLVNHFSDILDKLQHAQDKKVQSPHLSNAHSNIFHDQMTGDRKTQDVTPEKREEDEVHNLSGKMLNHCRRTACHQ